VSRADRDTGPMTTRTFNREDRNGGCVARRIGDPYA
jgi:hypothetical protein